MKYVCLYLDHSFDLYFKIISSTDKHINYTCFVLEKQNMLRSTLLVCVLGCFVLSVFGFLYLNRKKDRDYSINDI